jgi:hypothetical protein
LELDKTDLAAQAVQSSLLSIKAGNMRPGSCTTSSPGDIRDQILETKVDLLDATTIRVRAWPLQTYRNKWYSLFVNGVYTGRNYFVGSNDPFEAVAPADPASDTISAYLEDAGDWALFENDFVPLGGAETEDALSALRMQFSWQTSYQLTAVRGDSQLSGISITGASRGLNVAPASFGPSRGLLNYSITQTAAGGTYIVRFWNAYTLVAEGSIVGNGSLTCSAMNDSGLSVTCTLSYSADVKPGNAFLELRWPAAYYLFWSTSALNYGNPAQAIVSDTGADTLTYLTPLQIPGTYNCNILEYSDDGVLQSTGIPTPSVNTLFNAPLPATITSVTGTAAALTVHWTINEPGSFYTVYSSYVDYPPNLGNYATPAPVITSTDATSAVIPAVTGYPGKVRVIVRATQSGVQEHADNDYVVELDGSGNIYGTRPNRASIRTITITGGLTLNVEGCVIDDDASTDADTLDLYVVAYGSTIDLTSPQASIALPVADGALGVQRATASYTVGGTGWYRVAVNARVSATGARSGSYSEYLIYVDNSSPGAVVSPLVKVIRGK